MAQIPLCVDLDGTLIKGDTLWVSMAGIIRKNPLDGIGIAVQFMTRGRAHMKDWMSGKYLPNPTKLPYHTDVFDWVQEQKDAGRRLLLVTGAHRLIAESVVQHTGLFEEVIATANGYNMSGIPKAQELVRRFGEGGYDYAGNSYVDLPVWQCARKMIIVNASASVIQEAKRIAELERIFERPLKTGSINGQPSSA